MNLIIFPVILISIFHDDSVNPIGLTESRCHPLHMMCVFLCLDPHTQDGFFLCRETCCAHTWLLWPLRSGRPAHSSVEVPGCPKDALCGHTPSRGVTDLRTGSGYSNLAEDLANIWGGRREQAGSKERRGDEGVPTAQWLSICLLMQGTWAPATSHSSACVPQLVNTTSHNYGAHESGRLKPGDA